MSSILIDRPLPERPRGRRALAVLLLAAGLETTGLGLIIPVLPDLFAQAVPERDVAPAYTLMLGLSALVALLMAPALGALSDRWGRRPLLILSLAGTCIDFAIMAFWPAILPLLLGRIMAGLTGTTRAPAAAAIADLTSEPERPRHFGYLFAAYSTGFVLGPLCGGMLAMQDARLPFLCAAALTAAAFGLVVLALPETRRKLAAEVPPASRQLSPLMNLRWLFATPLMALLASAFLGLSFADEVGPALWAIHTGDTLGLSALAVGLSLTVYSLAGALSQAVLTAPLSAWLGTWRALQAALALGALALVVFSVLTEGWMIFLILPLSGVATIASPLLASLLAREAPASEQGRLQGALAALSGLTAVVGPPLYGALYHVTGATFPGAAWLFAGIVLLALLSLLRRPA